LDCQGCHVDPNGAGPRNQWGYYYSQDQLATVNFYKPIDPLQDQRRFDFHYDGRIITRATEQGRRTFPMSSELSLRVRPLINWVHLTYKKLFMGRIGESTFTAAKGKRQSVDRMNVMIDALPMNLYLKAGRDIPLYGLRRPNHSAWIRERIGLDQFATVDSINFGGTPNVPFFHVSHMLGDSNSQEEDRQVGNSAHGGMRGVTLAWHINGSYWSTTSKKAAIDMQALGLGGNLWGLVLYGERNWRIVTELPLTGSDLSTLKSSEINTQPSSTISEYSISYTGLRGVDFTALQEDLSEKSGDRRRVSLGVDLHPIPNLQIEFWRRTETGQRRLVDSVGVLHTYLDF
jgi:hypothetical protein